ncbi:LOW QUALITY PROTEIN: probable dolichyl pyrophosphate Man9GlcNAc2 alpha-1,3-glucosyltransferase [Drosophila tropicalis]|uniref:LOW QUALITY PROTEIN: probable dolichyl pyrophosphate Man9GlcNAc2 alpha-1,3-glucosyltransferase n=1 Tax=Drosophila tropicalis TaxID=46794 RepID=UPI0035ABAFC2
MSSWQCYTKAELLAITCFGMALRSIISLHPFSGFGVPPMFGDYEAQRHWQEVTIHLNVDHWYRNGTHNDLLYWGLDYPPLTAYHSYLMGRVAKSLDPRFVELHTSRGFETKEHKSFMRFTVLAADFLIYLPALISMCVCINSSFTSKLPIIIFILTMIYPGQILIDNGHFQYNNISLGMAALAIAAALREKYSLTAFVFTLALNYKQMELYHSLPFFVFILGSCLAQRSFSWVAIKFILIATIVLSTFGLVWYPWLRSLKTFMEVISRLFPVNRGVFEDKVASFWCSVNIIFKLKKYFSNHHMALICLGTTLFASLPTNLAVLHRRSQLGFLLSLFNTALVFFLFSYQVHEKTVLLITLPALCLLKWWPNEMFLFLEVSAFSMLPLLAKDKLLAPSIATIIIFHLTFKCIRFQYKSSNIYSYYLKRVFNISEIVLSFVVYGYVFFDPPLKYPDFWASIISFISSVYFFLFLIWGNIKQTQYI